jgi:hypothetical protein
VEPPHVHDDMVEVLNCSMDGLFGRDILVRVLNDELNKKQETAMDSGCTKFATTALRRSMREQAVPRLCVLEEWIAASPEPRGPRPVFGRIPVLPIWGW